MKIDAHQHFWNWFYAALAIHGLASLPGPPPGSQPALQALRLVYDPPHAHED